MAAREGVGPDCQQQKGGRGGSVRGLGLVLGRGEGERGRGCARPALAQFGPRLRREVRSSLLSFFFLLLFQHLF